MFGCAVEPGLEVRVGVTVGTQVGQRDQEKAVPAL